MQEESALQVESAQAGQQRGPLQKISYAVDRGISNFFRGLGRFVSRRPYLVISTCLLFTIGCAAMFFGLYEQELDAEDLYTPGNAQSFDDRDYVVEIFGSPAEEVRILVTRDVNLQKEKDCRKRNLLINSSDAKKVLLEYFSLFESIEGKSVTYKGDVYSLNDVCIKAEGVDVCQTKSVLDIWGHDRSLLEADDDVLGTINTAVQSGSITSRLGVPISPSFILGQNRKDGPCKGNTEVLQMSINLENVRVDVDGETIDPESFEWTLGLVDLVTDEWKNDNNLVGFVSSNAATEKESNDAVNRDVVKLTAGYILIVVFSHWILFKNSPVFCKAHLASASVLSVGMSIMTAFGLARLFGVKFNLVVQTLPFLLLGLGMDDTFVIMGAYHSTSIYQSVEDRMAETMARAGSSILVTSVTDVLAFVVGTYTDLPALQAFAIYAFLGIMFDFIYQVTFFTAFAALDARREQRAINGAPALGFQCGCASTQFDALPPTQAPKAQDIEKAVDQEPANGSIINGKNWKRKIFAKIPGDFDPKQPTLATWIAGEWLPKISLSRVGTIVILLIEAAVLAAAIYGCTKVKMDFRFREWFVPDGNYLKDAFKVEKTYFTGDQLPFSVYTKPPTDGQDFFSHQDEYIALVEAIRKDDYVSPIPPITSWYEGFSKWLVDESPFKDDIDKSTNRAPNATAFNDWVRFYLDDPAGIFYKNSVKFDENGISSTRFVAYTFDIVDGTFAVKTVDSIREAAEDAAPVFEPLAYTLNFLFFDGFKVIAWETVRNVLLAGIVVYIITTIVLADFLASSIVTLMIALTDVMLFGFLWYVDLAFNTVTAINMVLAIGIAVDYSAHIAHSFLIMKGTRKERAQAALHHIGGEVMAGAFTTWLAIAVMGFAEHYIFQTFFKMFFAIIVTGAWHGLVILPIILSMIGPNPIYQDT